MGPQEPHLQREEQLCPIDAPLPQNIPTSLPFLYDYTLIFSIDRTVLAVLVGFLCMPGRLSVPSTNCMENTGKLGTV
jgi:hypothetical protein